MKKKEKIKTIKYKKEDLYQAMFLSVIFGLLFGVLDIITPIPFRTTLRIGWYVFGSFISFSVGLIWLKYEA